MNDLSVPRVGLNAEHLDACSGCFWLPQSAPDQKHALACRERAYAGDRGETLARLIRCAGHHVPVEFKDQVLKKAILIDQAHQGAARHVRNAFVFAGDDDMVRSPLSPGLGEWPLRDRQKLVGNAGAPALRRTSERRVPTRSAPGQDAGSRRNCQPASGALSPSRALRMLSTM